ncbi:MAG: PQQ-dependent sugar dehydrogenase [Mangrovimonas sp.]|nr:PQQ-dependent sugar dehydrogenase [Mangrovimonas sp.]
MKKLKQLFTVLFLFAIFSNSYSQPYQLVNAFPNASFSAPLYVTHSNDGTDRVFVVEKGGRVKVLPNDSTTSNVNVFLDISNLIGTGSEKGLLGLAFHPDYANNGYFYVDYTRLSDGATTIARFNRSASDPNKADSLSQLVLMTIPQPYTNHNGGIVFFGLDGYLYIGMGDGGSGGDPGNRAQTLTEKLGKVLRINVDSTSGGNNYAIPPTNPFAQGGGAPEIFTIGMRNPWRISQDPVTGLIYCADVGQDAWEEIDILEVGKNYGWRCYEGDITYNTTNCGPMGNYTFPVFAEKHRTTGPNSLAGGFVYRGGNKCFQGVYFCAETRADTFYTIIPTLSGWSVDRKLFPGINNVAAFGEDEAGDLYAVSLNGTIYKIVGDDQTISGTPISPGIYSIKGNILSNGNIQSGSVEFIAAENVYLNPVFEVFPGATFLVNLGCGN